MQQCCNLCTLRVKMNVSGTKFQLEVLWICLFVRILSGKSRLCDKRVSAGSFNFIPHVQRINIGNNFYTEKNIVLWIFPDFDRNCSGRILKNLRRSSENCIFFQSSFLDNKYFLENDEFLLLSGFSEKTSVGVKKSCFLTVLGINFEEKCWLGTVLTFFPDIERKHFVLIATCFYREIKKGILLKQRIVFWGHFVRKKV